MLSLDAVAEWFLRLNGFFTVQNFVVRPLTREKETVQRTDADVLGIRFPRQREVVGGEALVDHNAFRDAPRSLLIIAEVKSGNCRLTGPWKRPEKENVTNVLRSFGQMCPVPFDTISKAIYDRALPG